MNRRRRFVLTIATLALFSLLALNTNLALRPTAPAHAAAATNPNYLAYATTDAQALQSWYNSSNGQFNTTGWWNAANALNALIDYSRLSGNRDYTGDIATTFNANSGGNFLNNYYDDEGWWGLTWVNAYDYTGNTTYLNMAKTIFSDMTGGWDSTCGGGIWWSKSRTYKNAIPNELFLTLAARLHERTPGDSGSGSYLDWANREWTWFSGSGMLNSSHLINDGLTSACQNNGQTTWTYNQGVILGGLSDLYKITGNTSYLSQAEAIASAAISTLVNANGVLKEPNEPCGTSCGGDSPQFKGIFMRNLAYLYSIDQQQTYANFILANANSIWQNDQNSAGQFGMMWYGPFDSADAARQSSALDALNAAIQFSSAVTFSTGFESGQPQPTWTNTVDNAGYPAGGLTNVGGICCGLSGPESGIRNEIAHTGSTALMYSGLDTSTTTSYAYMELFDLAGQYITVGPNTVLSYWIYPESPSGSAPGANLTSGDNSSCVAIDLIFSDNTNLRDSGATDQNGNRAHPAYQCGKLKMDSWNLETIDLGKFVNGKTIVRIDLGYDQPANTGGYRGYLDDLSIA